MENNNIGQNNSQFSPVGQIGQNSPESNQPAQQVPGNNNQELKQTVGLVQNQDKPAKEKKNKFIVMVVALIFTSSLSVTFIGLFVWANMQYREANTDLDRKISEAKVEATQETTERLEKNYSELEKEPRKRFAGPIDYGALSFRYPKTWSVYVAKDASRGGDFEAYLNPDYISPISSENLNALRVKIQNKPFEVVAKEYNNYLKQGKIKLSVQTINTETANIYTGQIDQKIVGEVAVFKLRDKTVILQTDANVFIPEFREILKTIEFNR